MPPSFKSFTLTQLIDYIVCGYKCLKGSNANFIQLNFPCTVDKQQVLQALARLQTRLRERGDSSQNEKLGIFRDTIESPLFNQIITLQHSIKQLKEQVSA